MNSLLEKASKRPARIIFPEGDDERVASALFKIRDLNIAQPLVFYHGKENRYSGFDVLDPYQDEVLDKYAGLYGELRKPQNLSKDKTKSLLKSNQVFTAALMVREGLADALIAGAAHATKDVARAVIHCLGPESGGLVSSCFLMDTMVQEFGYNGKFIFADCGVIVSPNSEQLAEIAINSGELFKVLFEQEPCIAILSYSTKGSASGDTVDKIREALEITKKKNPQLNIDGEMQADAAIVREVAKIKCPNSTVAGRANVLIFPDLNSGNICYKLVDRLTKARALGPIFLGTKYPASDLSRGCDSEEIVLVTAVISIMAQLKSKGL